MVAVDELFALLKSGKAPERGALRASETGVTSPHGPILVALDDSGRRHLLVPAGDGPVSQDARSRGVHVTSRGLEREGNLVVFADVVCQEPKLDLVFERLVADILRRVQLAPASPVVVVHQTLDQWRELLRSTGREVDRETVLGLTGELEVLARLGAANPARALDAWDGPERATHDFALGGRALEVKTTASVDGNVVQLSNIDQLDPVDLTMLHLVVVHCRELDTAPSLDDRIRSLIDVGFPEGRLVEAVHQAGYVFESGADSLPRYMVRGVRLWEVGQDFPGLRRADIREDRLRGVARIKYELALDSAPRSLTPAGANDLLSGWLDR